MTYRLTKEAIQDLLGVEGIDREGLVGIFVDPSEREYRRLFWRDDMENYTINRWEASIATTTVSYVNNEIAAFEGDYILKFVDSTESYTECRTRLFGQLPLLINALEVRWWRPATLKQMEFFFVTQPRSGLRYYGVLRWNDDVDQWQYRDSLLAWNNIEGTDETIRAPSWNYLRILVDFQNLRYHRLVSNGLDVNLSTQNIPLQVATPVVDACSYVGLRGRHTGPNNPSYVDDVRIYLNEV